MSGTYKKAMLWRNHTAEISLIVSMMPSGNSVRSRTVSEIGAGGCYILSKLKEKGFEATAIDPSPVAIKKGEELGIEVVPEFILPNSLMIAMTS